MTTKEMLDLSDKICDKLSDYRQEMTNAIITCMNERGVKEIDLRKMREDNEENGLFEVAERFDDIANNHLVGIYNKDGETLDCFIDRVTIKGAGFVECVCSGVQDPDFESTDSVRFLDIYTIMSVMEWVAEYFDVMDEMASKDNVK